MPTKVMPFGAADYPAAADVKSGVQFAYTEETGAYDEDYPAEADVKDGVGYANGGLTGSYVAPGGTNVAVKTGQTTSKAAGDDGDLEKGFSSTRFSAVSGNIFTDYGQNLMVIDNPAKIVPGTSSVAGSFEGLWQYSTSYSIGDVVGVDESVSYSGSVTYENDYYWAIGPAFKMFDGFSDGFRRDHEHVYVCTTAHTSGADWPLYAEHANYATNDIVNDGLGSYWKANKTITDAPGSMNFSDWDFLDIYTAKWERFQADTANWVATPWVGRTTGGEMAAFGWSEAITAINALTYGGYSDWRMANWKEVINLVDAEPTSLYARFGDGTHMTAYSWAAFTTVIWTSTSDKLYSNDMDNNALTVGANAGSYVSWYGSKTATCPVIIVRDAS